MAELEIGSDEFGRTVDSEGRVIDAPAGPRTFEYPIEIPERGIRIGGEVVPPNPRRVVDLDGERDHLEVERGAGAFELSTAPDRVILVTMDDRDATTCVYLTTDEATSLIYLLAARVHEVLGRG